MNITLYDKVAYKKYKRVDRVSSICGSIIQMDDKKICWFLPEAAEYGITKVPLKLLKRVKEPCDICSKNKFVKVFVYYNVGAVVNYVCKECLKKSPSLKYTLEDISRIDISPNAVADTSVRPVKYIE